MYNLKIAIRNLKSNGTYSIINIVGLSVSLAACILIMFWVYDELSYDRFYKRSDDIYLVTACVKNSEGSENYWRSTPTAVSYAGREEIPEVENACAVNPRYDLGYLDYNGKKFFSNRYIAVDTTFFRIFNTTFIEGSPDNALPDPYSVILTETTAKKIFGAEPALGKQLQGGNGQGDEGETYYVAGVVADHPKNSFLEYDAVFSFERSRWKNTWKNWSWYNFYLLQPDANKKEVTEKLFAIQQKNASGLLPLQSFSLQTLTDLRLHDSDGKETGMASVRLFSLIAIGLLFIACINYVNLTTARANKRNKEISVKKIMGAKKWKLLNQLMSETFIICSVALIVALILVFLLIPLYNQVTGKQFSFSLANPLIWITCGSIFLVIVILSGIYPALKLSAFKPLDVFRKQTTIGKSGLSLRKVLVVLQFAGVSGLIVATIVLNSQLHYIQNIQLGYDKEHVIEIQTFKNLDIRNHYESFKSDLEKEPAITGVTGTQQSILYAGFMEQIQWEGIQPGTDFTISVWGADRNLYSLLNIPLVEGSGFSGSPADSALCLLNETAVKEMGIKNPVGKRLSIPIYPKEYTIAGIVKDFHYEPLGSVIAPLVMYLPRYYQNIYIKTQPGKTKEALAEAEKVWKKYSPVFPFSYQFVDDAYNQIYKPEQQKSKLFNFFSLISIFVACLGLFGLVTYMAETKTKEIGIRKVLGASVPSIVNMLSKEFLILVCIAMLIAFPTAWYFSNKMLQDYAYRIGIGWWMFALAGIITIVLTLLTVGWQAIRAATANPVKSIKVE